MNSFPNNVSQGPFRESHKDSSTSLGADKKQRPLIALCLTFCALISNLANANFDTNSLPIVPLPVESHILPGQPFRITPSTVIACNAEVKETAMQLVGALQRVTDTTLKVDSVSGSRGNIVLRLDAELFSELPKWQREESYRLTVKSSGIDMAAPAQHGLFNGAQSLVQLVAPAGEHQWTVLPCELNDYPRFQWRGLLLDPARHFLPPEYLKKFIELMATYKYNRLHLHLTDGSGWRIEIKKYPRLTEVGSVRKESPKRGDRGHGDGKIYGPFFYSQQQMRELIAYANARHVTIVPEIEVPGHFGAAAAAYPEFTCTGRPLEVESAWRYAPDVLCAGNDAGIAFVKDVLGEICNLFPSEFIHIGGDEAPRERWTACPKCQARMKANNLQREAQLQTWINRQLETFLASKGRHMIGWDEILEGGLTPRAVVMSWRGSQGGIDAAKAGHDVIMSPTTHCYFDYPQAEGPNEPEHIEWGGVPTTRLSTVYSFDPVPSAIPAARRKHVLGTQGNIWGEFIWDGKDVEYFAFPRALALAEVSWSPVVGRNFENFVNRLNAQYPLLDRLQVNYRKPDAETTLTAPEAKPENK